MIRQLLWKEWREQRWKLAFGVVILVGFTAVGLRTRILPDDAVVTLGAGFGGIAFALLAVMGTVAADRYEGTLGQLLALPVRSWVVLLVKTVVGLAVCLGPLVAASILAVFTVGGREVSVSAMGDRYLVCAALATALFIWALAFGIRQPSEARAALAALGVGAAWLLSMVLLEIARQSSAPVIKVAADGLGYLSPFGASYWRTWPSGHLLVQAAIAVALWLWAARRFSRPVGRAS
jgi:ABC-type transport system involved in multi-copper enzyme maturation permease subunit